MNKILLSTALASFVCHSVYAVDAAPTTTPSNRLPSPPAQPANAAATPTVAANPTTLVIPKNINCKYAIPASVNNLDTALVTAWAKQAAVQSFNFNPSTIDNELTELKVCYTDQGWVGFNEALQKSGNIHAIKSQNLSVSSQVSGDPKINLVKDNQWKVTVPLEVVYQNDKQKLTQHLLVDLLVGRKMTGDLGVMQMIATPEEANTAHPAATPAASTPATGTTTGTRQ